MRENTKKLLLFLYPTQDQVWWLTFTQLHRLLPQLSVAGLRSALFLLDKREFLRIDRTGSEWRYALSSHGQSFVAGLFPVFSVTTKQDLAWLLLVFLQAPSSDRNFRFLRSHLLNNQGIQLTRGVYLLPEISVDKVQEELRHSYKNSVLLLRVGEWLFGDDYKIIGQKAGLSDLASVYSSISRELDRLISVKLQKKTFTQQENSTFHSALDRFLSTLDQDQSILLRYFPDVASPKQLLAAFQKLLLL